MNGLLILLFPVIEVFLFIKSGQHLGWINTILYFILVSILGARMVKYGMFKAVVRPGVQSAHGIFIVLAGIFFLIPGFISDFLGLLLIFPPTRYLLMRSQMNRFASWANGRVNVFFAGTDFRNTDFSGYAKSGEREARVIDITPLEEPKIYKQNQDPD